MRYSWLNAWLVVFAVAVGWMTVTKHYGFADRLLKFDSWVATAVLAIVLLLAVFSPRGVTLPDGRHRGAVAQAGTVYMRAWGILRRRWILIFIAVLLAIVLIGGVVGSLLENHYVGDVIAGNRASMRGVSGHRASMVRNICMLTVVSSPVSVRSSIGLLLPRVELPGGGFTNSLSALLVLVMIVPLWAKVRSWACEDRRSKCLRLLRVLLPALALVALAVVVIDPYSRLQMYQMASTRTMESSLLGTIDNVIIWIWGRASGLIVTPLLLAGLIGSLQRMSRVRNISLDTFLRDAVGSYVSLAGFFLLLFLVGLALDFPILRQNVLGVQPKDMELFHQLGMYRNVTGLAMSILTMLLMLVPFTIVLGGLGVLGGVPRGVKLFVGNIWTVLGFIAMGITIIWIYQTLINAVNVLAGWLFPAMAFLQMATQLMVVPLTVYLLVAVWGLFDQIACQEDAEMEPAPVLTAEDV